MHYYRKIVRPLDLSKPLMVMRLSTLNGTDHNERLLHDERCRQERETGQPVLIEPATREEWDEWFDKTVNQIDRLMGRS